MSTMLVGPLDPKARGRSQIKVALKLSAQDAENDLDKPSQHLESSGRVASDLGGYSFWSTVRDFISPLQGAVNALVFMLFGIARK